MGKTLTNASCVTDALDAAHRAGLTHRDRIDWILTSPDVRTHHAVIDTYSGDGQYPSDHLPVRTVLEL